MVSLEMFSGCIVFVWSSTSVNLYSMNAEQGDGTAWRLRPAREGDFDAVARLLSESELPTEGLRDQFGDSYVVAERGGSIVGAGGVEVYGPYGLLRSVAVSCELRGGQLGKALVEDRMDWASDRKLRAVYLLTTTATGFFEKLGFSAIDRQAIPDEVKISCEFSGVCPESAVAMVLVVRGN